MVMSRQQAGSISKAAQGGLLLAAVALGFLLVKGFPAVEIARPTPPEPVKVVKVEQRPDNEPKVIVDSPSIGKRFGNIANAPKKPEVSTEVSTAPPPPPKEPEFTPGDAVKFIGAIRVGSRHLAVVTVTGKQSVYSEGKTLSVEQNGSTHTLIVKAVSDEALVLTEKDKDFEIPLAGRAISKAGGAKPAGPLGNPTQAAPPNPGAGKSGKGNPLTKRPRPGEAPKFNPSPEGAPK